ncbi:MAG: alpha/beta hydrolase [Candidatus Binatia bacterium]
MLAVHPGPGVKELWGPIALEGYSFAHRRVAEGRAVFAIDLPGYNESEGPMLTIEQYAIVVHQVATAIRLGGYSVEGNEAQPFPHVVGAGLSMGGAIVELAQSTFGSFDALVSAGWSQVGLSEEARVCFCDFDCPDLGVSMFHTANADPEAIAAVKALPFQDPGLQTGISSAFWSSETCDTESANRFSDDELRPDRVNATITVPVLRILGDRDFWFRRDRLGNEAEDFPSSPDARLLLLADTGHFVFHHLDRDLVHATIDGFLDDQGL